MRRNLSLLVVIRVLLSNRELNSPFEEEVTMYEPNDEDIHIQRVILDEDSRPFIIRLYYNTKGTLFGFIAYGETGFTQYGLDIIAAGVSALIINTVHSLEYLTEDKVETEMHKNYSKCILPNLQTKNKGSREAIVLLQSLEIGIHSIQNTYGKKHITIEEVFLEQKAGLFLGRRE